MARLTWRVENSKSNGIFAARTTFTARDDDIDVSVNVDVVCTGGGGAESRSSVAWETVYRRRLFADRANVGRYVRVASGDFRG